METLCWRAHGRADTRDSNEEGDSRFPFPQPLELWGTGAGNGGLPSPSQSG